jgi:hypothetical protein
VQQAGAQLAMAPISAWRSCFQEFRDIAPNSGLKGNTMHKLSLAESFAMRSGLFKGGEAEN